MQIDADRSHIRFGRNDFCSFYVWLTIVTCFSSLFALLSLLFGRSFENRSLLLSRVVCHVYFLLSVYLKLWGSTWRRFVACPNCFFRSSAASRKKNDWIHFDSNHTRTVQCALTARLLFSSFPFIWFPVSQFKIQTSTDSRVSYIFHFLSKRWARPIFTNARMRSFLNQASIKFWIDHFEVEKCKLIMPKKITVIN